MKLSTAVKSAVLAAPILVVSFAGTLSAQSSSSGASLVACDATMASGAVAQINSTHSTVYTSILIDTLKTCLRGVQKLFRACLES